MSEATSLTHRALDPAAEFELQDALRRLRAGRGLLVRTADLMGGTLGRFTRLGARGLGIPPSFQHKFTGIAEVALMRAYDVAILGLPAARERPPGAARKGARGSRGLVMLSGTVCGFLGLPGFLPDVTVTTLTIMREIARIAREEGEDLSREDARRACLEVFALNSGEQEPESELGYFSARFFMQGRPLMLFLTEVAGRYGLSLSQKLAVQAVPIAGAIAGAALNTAFLDHYGNLARAHFVIRRLERTYGVLTVQEAISQAAA